MRTPALVAVLISLASCGSTLAVRSACAQAARCGQLAAGVTEDSCVAAWETELDRLRALHRENCTKLVTATTTLFACRGSLTCEQSADIRTTKCAQANEDWNVANSVASVECH